MLIDISVAQQEFIVQQRVSERASNVYHLSSRLTRRQSLISPRDVYSFFYFGRKELRQMSSDFVDDDGAQPCHK